MKKQKEKTELKQKNQKGITLIALVITIIVLLILAGVTIATLTGENGILTRASEASEQTKKANIEEQVKLTVTASIGEDGRIDISKLNEELQKIEGEKTGIPISSLPADITIDGYEVHIDGNGIVSIEDNSEHTGNDNIKEYTSDGVPIPKGFYYVGGTKEKGVVISDAEVDENQGTSWETAKTLVGNQFVWVPIENYEKFIRIEGYERKKLQTYLSNCGEADSTGNNTNSEVIETEITKKEAQEMYTSVKNYKGFFVGRYEAGKGENKNVIIKQGVNVYWTIKWSSNGEMQETQGTTGGAVELARNVDVENGYTSVISTLCYGVQWDAIMQWIDPAYKDGNCDTENSFVANSTKKGHVGINISTSGSDELYVSNNIYDLAGNASEWTMESYKSELRVCRGGRFNFSLMGYPASNRSGERCYSEYVGNGFRVTLYIK